MRAHLRCIGPSVSPEVVDPVFRDLYAIVLAFVRHRLPARWHLQAQDITQDTLMEAWCALARSDARAVRDLRPYAIGIARHKIHDAVLKEARRRIVSIDILLERELEQRAERSDTCSRAGDWGARLMRAIQRLRPVEREIVLMCFIDCLSHQEACRRIVVTPDEGSRLKYRALQKLRWLLRVNPPAAAQATRTSRVADRQPVHRSPARRHTHLYKHSS